MATAKQFEDLKVWQEARVLVNRIYDITKERLFRRDFTLKDQIIRASTSTMSNIAEGFERGTRKEFIHFLNIAKGSNGEVRSQLYVALDQQYIDQKKFEALRESCLTLSRRIAKFIDYLERVRTNARRLSRQR
ncbi:MAG: four helix bundle protein [Verrucomicrobia bacterium]|nr:MAG: four helix bundle protein [Verrucomicrobiota bacterium]